MTGTQAALMWVGIATRLAAHAVGRHAPACRGRYCMARTA